MHSYLAFTALIAAGLDEIERRLEPGKRNDDNLYEVPEEELRRRGIGFLPTTLNEALDRLEGDQEIRDALGADYARASLRAAPEDEAPWERVVGGLRRVDVHVLRLRQKLEHSPGGAVRLETIRGIGYRSRMMADLR